ncbi:MAG: phage portal protein [Eubacterium sp.]|nr:phage portal protein [Eubacterium sp.]
MQGLALMVQHSTILPQCIRAYKNNIAGFGISVCYTDDIKETDESKKEWDTLKRILDLLSIEKDAKEIFEKIVEDREKYGIAYLEVIRDMKGLPAEVVYIEDTPSVEMTYPMRPYVDITYFYHGEQINRKKKFRKFRQQVGGKTVYFKEFGDPRVMDKRSGSYIKEGETLAIDLQANEILDFTVGSGYYGTVRWIGQALTVDGNYRAESLNNNYFRNGRHVPLMIIIKNGTLSDESFGKLQEYMNSIKGEQGQHAFMILETEQNETSTDFTETEKADIEIKELGSVLQTDELFQGYQESGRKKIQSAFLLPDLYTGYTTDFNRATAQVAMEITEKQVFQPERASLAWQLNNKLLNEYSFRFVKAKFESPDMTNPDDMMKILNISERAGGMTLNDARALTKDVLGMESEDYPKSFDMEDIGNVPLAVINAMTVLKEYGKDDEDDKKTPFDNGEQKPEFLERQLEEQIEKAADNHEDEVVAVMKEVRRLLKEMGGAS